MFHGVQARNQIFLGEFQLSDKVGCILAYPGSYPPTIPYRTPQVPPGNTPLGCIVVGAAIPLPLGRVNPSVAAWIICTRPIRIPILLRQNAQRWGDINNKTTLWWKYQTISFDLHECIICTRPIHIPIFRDKLLVAKTSVANTWGHINNEIPFWWKHQMMERRWCRWDDDTRLLIRGVRLRQGSCQRGGRSASGEAFPPNP